MLIAEINMPMPETCHVCPFSRWHYTECECFLSKKHFSDNSKLAYSRNKKICPLKEKPS